MLGAAAHSQGYERTVASSEAHLKATTIHLMLNRLAPAQKRTCNSKTNAA